MKEFLKELGIQGNPVESGKSLVLDIEGSDNYGRIYSKLDRSELVEEDSESSNITLDGSTINFESEKYLITLIADFNGDKYKLTIKER